MTDREANNAIEIDVDQRNELEENLGTGAKIRRLYATFLRRMFSDERYITYVKIYFAAHLIVMTISRLVISSLMLRSTCKDEFNAGLYLFVKSWPEIFLYSVILWVLFRDMLQPALDNLFLQIWMFIQTIFLFIWLILGTYWVFGKYKKMVDECHLHVIDFQYHFINFAVVWTALDWVIVVVFAIYSLYVVFDWNREEN